MGYIPWKACILMPIYNMKPELLRASIMSAIRQTYPVDVFILDDHSTDKRSLQMAHNILKIESRREKRKETKRAERDPSIEPHVRLFKLLKDGSYNKKDFPTAGRVMNSGVEYAFAMGYHWFCIMGGDDIALPDFAAACLGHAYKNDHSNLISVDCRCLMQLDQDSSYRQPFIAGERMGKPIWGTSPPWWKTSHAIWYKYPETPDKPMTDWYVADWVREHKYDVEHIGAENYVYVFHEKMLSASIHHDRAARDLAAIRDHIKGKKFRPEIDKYWRYLIERGKQYKPGEY